MTITFEQLIAAALVKFKGKIDTLDVSILISMINEPYSFSNKNCNKINSIIEFQNNNYQLKDGFNLDTILVSNLTVKECLEMLAKTPALKFIKELDLTYFILRKINQLGIVLEINLNSGFNEIEKDEIARLIKDGYLYAISTKKTLHDEERSIILSKKGEVYLFMRTYQEQIREFKNELIARGYEPDLLNSYLNTENLHRPFKEIFDVSNFENYLKAYNLDFVSKRN